MKRFLTTLTAAVLIVVAVFVNAQVHAQTPPITVPPHFTEPQEQASNLAVPDQAEPGLVNVVVIVLCNKVVGLFGTDATGEIHMLHFTTKAQVTNAQMLVDGAHDKAINLGCPGNVAKDTTVL